MKYVLLIIFLAGATLSQAQITFRNQISLNKKLSGKQLAMTFIAVAIGANIPNSFGRVGYNSNRQGLVIDINAITSPRKYYTYNEIVYKLYTNNGAYTTVQPPVPFYLLMPPPARIAIPEYSGSRLYKHLN